MVTILEALQNAKINLIDNKQVGFCWAIGAEQLLNSVCLLEKGYPVHTLVEGILEQYPNIADAPEYKER